MNMTMLSMSKRIYLLTYSVPKSPMSPQNFNVYIVIYYFFYYKIIKKYLLYTVIKIMGTMGTYKEKSHKIKGFNVPMAKMPIGDMGTH